MKKKYLTQLCTVLLALISGNGPAFAQFIPSDIEKERVRPQEKIELPKIQTVPDAVDYFFEPRAGSVKPGEKYPVVHMRIPKAPYFEKNSSSGPTRSYGIHITMFYPNFSGMADPENFECHEDAMSQAGKMERCRRKLIVGFGYTPKHHVRTAYEGLQLQLQEGFLEPLNEKSKYPELELVGTDISDANNRYYEVRSTYYVSRDLTEEQKYVIKCKEFVASPVCEVDFRSKKSPFVDINLSFGLELLPDWKEVIEKTRDKVDSMIIKTYEFPATEEIER